jgi:hypothetical protein
MQVNWQAAYCNNQDNWNASTGILSGNFQVSGGFNQYYVSLTLPSGAVNGVEIIFSLANFTSGTFTMTGVQLEVGATPSAFDVWPYDWELLRCLRYCPCFTTIGNGVAGALAVGVANSGTTATFSIAFPAPARTTAVAGITAVDVSTYSDYLVLAANGTYYTVSAISVVHANASGAILSVTCGTGLTTGQAVILAVSGASEHMYFTGSEL